MAAKLTFSTGHDRSKWRTYSQYLTRLASNPAIPERIYNQAFLNVHGVAQAYAAADVRSLRTLEIGCGQRFAATLLFHSLGVPITGIDTDCVTPSLGPRSMLRIWRCNGPERLAKTVVRRALFDRYFYATLARCFARDFGRPLRWDGLDLRLMDACQLDFAAGAFDFVFSRAVFEHVDGVDRACCEIARVLRPAGVAFIEVHLYASLSGGHNLEWAQPAGQRQPATPPWDHLRQNLHPAPCYLNRLRLGQYLDLFQANFDLLDVRYAHEGEQYLTDEILRELPDYSREELLTKTLSVVLQKPHRAAAASPQPPRRRTLAP